MDNFYHYISLNRNITESRPFDFIYDPDYSVPTLKNFNKLAENAIKKTCEKEIKPIYTSMFSDIPRFPKMELVFKTELVRISWEEKKKKEIIKIQDSKNNPVSGRNQINFVSKSNIDLPMKIRLENFNNSSAQKIYIKSIGSNAIKTIQSDLLQYEKRKTKFNKFTQTDYRDSETQTDSWIPPHKDQLNLILLRKPQGKDPVLEYEVNTVDEKKKIEELKQVLSTVDQRNLKIQTAITKKIERIEWFIKEKKIDYINNIRMELAQKLLYKKSVQTQTNIICREEAYQKMQMEIKNRKLKILLNNSERGV